MNNKIPTPSCAIFCRVIDNYGDFGVCWRLARQLAQEHGCSVTLFVDDWHIVRRFISYAPTNFEAFVAEQVIVQPWSAALQAIPADYVLSTFQCRLPDEYLQRMAERNGAAHLPSSAILPLRWVNIEYLTAEDWIESHHGLPSLQPRWAAFQLAEYFYYPGFTAQTGGLLREKNLITQQHAWSSLSARAQLFAKLGVADINPHTDAPTQQPIYVSLFCYENPALDQLLSVWRVAARPVHVFVADGVAPQSLKNWLPEGIHQAQHGALSLQRIPFLSQLEYDQLLWSCDLNFVRGEDSWVRAQWAHTPFIWQIYPQNEQSHHAKLRAFLEKYWQGAPLAAPAEAPSQHQAQINQIFARAVCAWNAVPEESSSDASALPFDWTKFWEAFCMQAACWRAHQAAWRQHLLQQDDLCTRLLRFLDQPPYFG